MFKKLETSQQKLKIFTYAPSGAGKTSLIKTLKGKVACISAESGLLSISSCADNIDVLDLNEAIAGKLPTCEQKLAKLRESYKYLLTPEAKKTYSWVAIDSLSEIAQIVLECAKNKYTDKKDTFNVWNDYSATLLEIVKVFRDLDYNVYITSLSETTKDENGARFNDVMIQTKLAQQIPAFFDEVFFIELTVIEKGEAKRRLITSAMSRMLTKDRSGKLGVVEDCNLGLIEEKILGQKVETISALESVTK